MKRLHLISTKPRLLTCSKFLSDVECDRLVEIGKRECFPLPGDNKLRATFNLEEDKLDRETKAFLRLLEYRMAAITNTPYHEEEAGLQLHFTPTEEHEDGRLTLGLHTDTNHRFFRFVTALVYLNDLKPEDDGETVFPLIGKSETSPLVRASKLLLENEVEHTNTANNPDFEDKPEISMAAQFLLDSTHDKTSGLHVKPEKGRLVLFYSRDRWGNVDPYGWHGGACVLGTGKWTLQKFKEVPREHRRSEWDFRHFINLKYGVRASSSGSENYIVVDDNKLDDLD